MAVDTGGLMSFLEGRSSLDTVRVKSRERREFCVEGLGVIVVQEDTFCGF